MYDRGLSTSKCQHNKQGAREQLQQCELASASSSPVLLASASHCAWNSAGSSAQACVHKRVSVGGRTVTFHSSRMACSASAMHIATSLQQAGQSKGGRLACLTESAPPALPARYLHMLQPELARSRR